MKLGFYYHLLREKMLTFKGDQCHGGKQCKERVTLLLGAKMIGTNKLDLLVIGKFLNSHRSKKC